MISKLNSPRFGKAIETIKTTCSTLSIFSFSRFLTSIVKIASFLLVNSFRRSEIYIRVKVVCIIRTKSFIVITYQL